MWYYVYILYQRSRKNFYIGFTKNLKRRIAEHERGSVSATKFKENKPKLIFSEAFLSKEDAKRREKYFKTTKGKKALRLMLREYLRGWRSGQTQ